MIVSHSTPVTWSPRVAQVAGLFDLQRADASQVLIECDEPPPIDDDWQIGLVVGPSGSGKTSVARQLWPDAIFAGGPGWWSGERSVVDDFDRSISIRDVTATLTAVGFSSPPAWLRPYAVLSGGERMRADLARALLVGGDLVVYDEFTSVVDRTVAKVCSAALAKGLRAGRFRCRKFIALSCHYDIQEWLAPDWILDMATGRLARSCLQRPPIVLRLRRATRRAWARFQRHHYLSANIHAAARCYVAWWDEEPVAFVATMAIIGVARMRRVSRVVVLPDYQGVGIGSAVLARVASIEAGEGYRVTISTSHPGLKAHLIRSRSWASKQVDRFAPRNKGRPPTLRYVSSFEWEP